MFQQHETSSKRGISLAEKYESFGSLTSCKEKIHELNESISALQEKIHASQEGKKVSKLDETLLNRLQVYKSELIDLIAYLLTKRDQLKEQIAKDADFKEKLHLAQDIGEEELTKEIEHQLARSKKILDGFSRKGGAGYLKPVLEKETTVEKQKKLESVFEDFSNEGFLGLALTHLENEGFTRHEALEKLFSKEGDLICECGEEEEECLSHLVLRPNFTIENRIAQVEYSGRLVRREQMLNALKAPDSDTMMSELGIALSYTKTEWDAIPNTRKQEKNTPQLDRDFTPRNVSELFSTHASLVHLSVMNECVRVLSRGGYDERVEEYLDRAALLSLGLKNPSLVKALSTLKQSDPLFSSISSLHFVMGCSMTHELLTPFADEIQKEKQKILQYIAPAYHQIVGLAQQNASDSSKALPHPLFVPLSRTEPLFAPKGEKKLSQKQKELCLSYHQRGKHHAEQKQRQEDIFNAAVEEERRVNRAIERLAPSEPKVRVYHELIHRFENDVEHLSLLEFRRNLVWKKLEELSKEIERLEASDSLLRNTWEQIGQLFNFHSSLKTTRDQLVLARAKYLALSQGETMPHFPSISVQQIDQEIEKKTRECEAKRVDAYESLDRLELFRKNVEDLFKDDPSKRRHFPIAASWVGMCKMYEKELQERIINPTIDDTLHRLKHDEERKQKFLIQLEIEAFQQTIDAYLQAVEAQLSDTTFSGPLRMEDLELIKGGHFSLSKKANVQALPQKIPRRETEMEIIGGTIKVREKK